MMADRRRHCSNSLPTRNRETGKTLVGTMQRSSCSQVFDTNYCLQLKSSVDALASVGIPDSRLDTLNDRTSPVTETKVETDDSSTTSGRKTINLRNGSDVNNVSRKVSRRARGHAVQDARIHTEPTAVIDTELEVRIDLTSQPVKTTVRHECLQLRDEAKKRRVATVTEVFVLPAAAAISDANNTSIASFITSQSKSLEEIMEITKDFCRNLDCSESFVANVYYSDIDSLVHIEVKEENRQEAEKFVKEMKAKSEMEQGYCPQYTIELYEPGEYRQTCSPPPRSNEDKATIASAVQVKPPLRPGTHIQSTTDDPNVCLFSGTLTGNKGMSVGHAFSVDQEVEMMATDHHPEVYRSTFGRCVRVFDSLTNQPNGPITADVAIIEIDPHSCNPENTLVCRPSGVRQRVRVNRGPAAVPGDTRVMIIDQNNRIKYGYIRREHLVRGILADTNLHNMLAISSQREYMRHEAITGDGDSGALVMSVPSDAEGSGGNGDIDVYGIVTGVHELNSSSLTVANDLPKVLHSLSDMSVLPPDADFQ